MPAGTSPRPWIKMLTCGVLRFRGRSAEMAAAKAWMCPTCERKVATPFCPECGERPLAPRDLTLRGMFAQLCNAITNIDGRLLPSLRCLVNRPGVLTVAYVQGRRAPYIGPFQLFLIANVFFFAAQSL